MKISNNKILITGGASGIGLGLTERFIKENNTVIICGRRESLLKEVSKKNPSLITRRCDLSDAGERKDLFNWISENHNDLNVLINNAGIQQWMPIYSASKAFFHSFTLSTRHILKSGRIEVIEMIPPALNTDLGGKGLHTSSPPVTEFIDSVFTQLKQGKTEIAYGFSEGMTKAGPEDLQKAFNRMNNVQG